MADPILSIRNLCVDYVTDRGPVRAVDRVSLDVQPGEIVGIAGESGSGKSTMAQALLRILPPPAVISGGEVLFEGRDILALEESELRSIRWNRISMVFQSAMNSLNPVVPIGEQITDTLNAHRSLSSNANQDRAKELLEMVGIPPDRLSAYPHQLSGGMRQRVGIAVAMALEPSLIILDEPTTALDVVVERQILEQIRALQRKLGFSVLFITHDLARMLQFSDRVAILYAAQLAELGSAAKLKEGSAHPYTQALLRSFPTVHGESKALTGIPGSPPSLARPPEGCRFHPRCERAEDRCRSIEPVLRDLGPGHAAACHLAE